MLARRIDWQRFDSVFAECYCLDTGAPGKDIRLLVGLHYLKHTFNESDESLLERWVENSVSVQRGPLVYALKIREEWTEVENQDKYGNFREVRPLDPWNIGLLEAMILDPETGFEFVSKAQQTGTSFQEDKVYPWTLENAPVLLRTKGRIIPDWILHREMAGPLPHSLPLKHLQNNPPREITLIPYGCTTLRITEFPVVR